MNNSEIRWPRYDPNRGYKLCENCWNQQHFVNKEDDFGKKIKNAPNCLGNGCECGCRPEFKAPRKPKYTKAGQMQLPETDPLFVGPKAAELKAQVEALKR